MKLILCPHCQDILKILPEKRFCSCGKCYSYYTDRLNAVVSKEAIPLGLSNPSLIGAIAERPQEGMGSEFTAFVLPEKCQTISLK
jgi:hypothetical protein